MRFEKVGNENLLIKSHDEYLTEKITNEWWVSSVKVMKYGQLECAEQMERYLSVNTSSLYHQICRHVFFTLKKGKLVQMIMI